MLPASLHLCWKAVVYTEQCCGTCSRMRNLEWDTSLPCPSLLNGSGAARPVAAAESVHTINALLTEMDGFEDNTGVVVMAATNRPEALDSALIRAGRFDRTIEMPMPDVEVRGGEGLVHGAVPWQYVCCRLVRGSQRQESAIAGLRVAAC